jgi:hypothetical protein
MKLESRFPHSPNKKHFAAVLDQADELRRKRLQANALRTLRSSLFHAMFLGNEDATWPTGRIGDVA